MKKTSWTCDQCQLTSQLYRPKRWLEVRCWGQFQPVYRAFCGWSCLIAWASSEMNKEGNNVAVQQETPR